MPENACGLSVPYGMLSSYTKREEHIMYHPNEDVQDFIDLALDNNRKLTSPDTVEILQALENLVIRDEVLCLALGDTDEAFHLGQFIQEYAVDAPSGYRANPAIMSSIINYVHNERGRAELFYNLALLDDESNKLAFLFGKIVEVGVPPTVVRELIAKAVEG